MKRLRMPSIVVVSVLALLATTQAAAGPSSSSSLTTLTPGKFLKIEQTIPVNVVFVGYEEGTGATEVDESDFLAGLPGTYRSVNRYPSYYLGTQFNGLEFSYEYDVTWADSDFEDAFFGYLGSIASPRPLTLFQELYNEQVSRSLDVTDNAWIDAPSVEQWLADNAEPELGVDTSDYTVFFVNWYGRPDFRFHVYTKTDEPDPDTDYNFGELRETRKLIAWGGTTPDDEENGLGSLHRLWFYDLSAGPEGWTDNWNVDDADLDGNGATDYRMPPVWEYGNLSAYRAFDDLTGDLAKVARYVAIDMLFTTSPLYKVALSPPALPSDIQLDINVYQGDPAADGKDFFVPSLIEEELGEVQPLNTFEVELSDAAFTSRAADIYLCFLTDVSCYGRRLFGIAFADLFLYHTDHLLRFLEGDGDYEVPLFAYNVTADLAQPSLLGFADDNWADGTQSYVFAFDDPSTRDIGYGFTTTVIHEVGHHLGFSHPHDGYDYEADVDFNPADEFYFAWSGDESNSIMSYIDLNWDFSQFDRDNMDRFFVATYLNQANVILAKVLKAPRAMAIAGALISSADAHAGDALDAYGSMDYPTAAEEAKLAYEDVLAAAAKLRVPVEPQSWQADYKAKSPNPSFVDTIPYDKFFN